MVISTTGILLLYAKVSLPFIMYYGSALLLFTRKLHCLQTFWLVPAHWVVRSYLSTKFQTCISYGFGDTGIQTEERERQDILISCGCMLLFTNM